MGGARLILGCISGSDRPSGEGLACVLSHVQVWRVSQPEREAGDLRAAPPPNPEDFLLREVGLFTKVGGGGSLGHPVAIGGSWPCGPCWPGAQLDSVSHQQPIWWSYAGCGLGLGGWEDVPTPLPAPVPAPLHLCPPLLALPQLCCQVELPLLMVTQDICYRCLLLPLL